jgi:hypothetical protein
VAKILPPSELIVGTQVFEVVLRSPKDDGMLSEGSCGYTLDTDNLIVIDSTLSWSKQRQTFTHEMLHAMRMVFGSTIKPKKTDNFEDWEHYFIGIYEEVLLVVLRDNPKVVEYFRA